MKNQDNEIVYPIYNFLFSWTQDGVQDPKHPNWYVGLPEGRIHNGTGFSKMFKEDQSQETLDQYAKDWYDKYIVREDKEIINPELVKITAEFSEYETWFLTWFCHETIDNGQTDEEVLESFERFVCRKEKLGRENHCLMGAEDRWRWHGGTDDNTPPPCRCEFCKEQGVLRIGH